MPAKITQTEFIKRSNQIHNFQYDYTHAVYENIHIKVEIICKKHGSYFMTPSSHLHQRQGCYKCANELKSKTMTFSKKQFISNAYKIHGDRYDYSKSKYIDAYTKVEIICKEHGVFEQTPSNHIHNKANCPKCSGVFMDTKFFKEKAYKIHGSTFDYSKVNYINNITPIEIICNKHGSFFQKPSTHLYCECGCPSCNESSGEQRIRLFLEQNNIHFESQYKLPIKGHYKRKHLRFDFFIPFKKIAIEFDGLQHFKYIPHFHSTKRIFKNQQQNDLAKNRYAKKMNIQLIRIKYDQYNLIKEILLSII